MRQEFFPCSSSEAFGTPLSGPLHRGGPVAEGFQALHQAPGPHYHIATGFRAAADATTLLMA